MDIPDLSGSELSEKERKIIESSIRIFSEKGFSAATTSEIAKDAGVAEGTIFRYFKTKKDILRAILIQAINLVSSRIVISPVEKILLSSEAKDLRTVLKELFVDRMKLVDNFFPMARVIFTEALYHEDVREALFQNMLLKARNTFETFHEILIKKGIIRKDINADSLFRCILGNFMFFIIQRKLFSGKLQSGDIDKEFDQMLDVMLYGISNERSTLNGE